MLFMDACDKTTVHPLGMTPYTTLRAAHLRFDGDAGLCMGANIVCSGSFPVLLQPSFALALPQLNIPAVADNIAGGIGRCIDTIISLLFAHRLQAWSVDYIHQVFIGI